MKNLESYILERKNELRHSPLPGGPCYAVSGAAYERKVRIDELITLQESAMGMHGDEPWHMELINAPWETEPSGRRIAVLAKDWKGLNKDLLEANERLGENAVQLEGMVTEHNERSQLIDDLHHSLHMSKRETAEAELEILRLKGDVKRLTEVKLHLEHTNDDLRQQVANAKKQNVAFANYGERFVGSKVKEFYITFEPEVSP